MKYIITEQQAERFTQTIIDYLNDNLTPIEGWQTTKEYKKELKENDSELFLFIKDVEQPDENDHMWYSTHKNPHVEIEKGESPVVLIPDSKVNALDGYFGDLWRPIFIEWFQNNTGLKVKKVDNFGWVQ